MCKVAVLALECSPRSAGVGRHFTTDTLVEWGVGAGDPAWETLADVSLIVTELLGNASRFSTVGLELRMEAHRGRIRLSVSDNNPAPALTRTIDCYDLSGRGLAIVRALSTEWGQTPFDGETKLVWADVGFSGKSVLGLGCTV